MDLYFQIGVILLVMTAFSLLAFVLTSVGEHTNEGINQQQQTMVGRLETLSGLDVAKFRNAPSVSGSQIYPIIRDAKASKLAVIVQTKNQQGLVVNYGYQIRASNYSDAGMVPFGYAGTGGGASATGTEFERNFVTTVRQLFTPSGASTSAVVFGPNARTTFTDSNISTNAAAMMAVLQPSAEPPGASNASALKTPLLSLSDPTTTVTAAVKAGKTFAATGLLYTNHILKTDAAPNVNLSYADSAGSIYRFDRNASYYTTLIADANGAIIGVYVEEHGVAPSGAVLGTTMYYNGVITQLY